MRKGLTAVLLLISFSLTATAYAVSVEDSASENLSQDLADTKFENVNDSVSDVGIDQSTAISESGNRTSETVWNSAIGNYEKVSTFAYPSNGQCGLRVNRPHASYTTSEQIHTRIESFCKVLPLVSNTVSGKTYRSRWYGWQRVATLSPATATAPSTKVQNYRRTAVANCKAGDWYRYRTEGFGTISTGVQSFSAAAYEQNDDEIQCVRR